MTPTTVVPEIRTVTCFYYLFPDHGRNLRSISQVRDQEYFQRAVGVCEAQGAGWEGTGAKNQGYLNKSRLNQGGDVRSFVASAGSEMTRCPHLKLNPGIRFQVRPRSLDRQAEDFESRRIENLGIVWINRYIVDVLIS